KVLEAMAMARPVLLTPEAATGIDAEDGVHFAVGASDEALIARANALLADGPGTLALAASARRYVVERQSWPAMLAPLAGIVGRLKSQKRNAA
ncbi:glycosyl transferase family 1, partial [Sphingomonadaceae bacterium]|nr:glycosyl transferase family 1 [Sphingomonadaceae bacterium]